jgi:hypothetical protein
MKKRNRSFSPPGAVDEDLDQAIHAALARSLSVEPRPGLEDRVLAHLHSRQNPGQRASWGWGFAVVFTVLTLVLAGVTWKEPKTRMVSTTDSPPSRTLTLALHPDAASGVSRNGAHKRRSPKALRGRPTAEKPLPKLDQFPSSRPLSEQEKILAYYVHADPEQAALLAVARMNALRQEIEERSQMLADPAPALDSNE